MLLENLAEGRATYYLPRTILTTYHALLTTYYYTTHDSLVMLLEYLAESHVVEVDVGLEAD